MIQMPLHRARQDDSFEIFAFLDQILQLVAM